MNFRQFLEAFGNYNYVLPEDKEQQLFDFYMLAYLKPRSSWDRKISSVARNQGYNLTAPGTSYRGEMDENDKISYTLDEVAKVLLPQLKKNLLDAVFFSICSEVRHVFDYGYDVGAKSSHDDDITANDLLSPDEYGYFKRYARNLIINSKASWAARDRNRNRTDLTDTGQHRKQSYRAFLKTKASPHEFVTIARKLFNEPSFWEVSYGGKAWVDICDAWLMLFKATKESNLFVAIDHLYDMQHNTDTVFNKVQSYMKDDSYEWIKDALDLKANIKSPYALIEKISPSMKKIAYRAIKIKTGQSYEDFIGSEMNGYSNGNEYIDSILNNDKILVSLISILNSATKYELGAARIISWFMRFHGNSLSKMLGISLNKLYDHLIPIIISTFRLNVSAGSIMDNVGLDNLKQGTLTKANILAESKVISNINPMMYNKFLGLNDEVNAWIANEKNNEAIMTQLYNRLGWTGDAISGAMKYIIACRRYNQMDIISKGGVV